MEKLQEILQGKGTAGGILKSLAGDLMGGEQGEEERRGGRRRR